MSHAPDLMAMDALRRFQGKSNSLSQYPFMSV